MTITAQSNKISHQGDGQTFTFPFPFRVDSADDMKVYLDGEPKTAGIAVRGFGSDAGGSVTLDPVPAAGVTVTLVRELDYTQDVAYPAYTRFPAATHELALDRLTQMIQQVAEKADRALTIPVDEILDMTLPEGDRDGKFLSFDADGQPVLVDSAQGGGEAGARGERGPQGPPGRDGARGAPGAPGVRGNYITIGTQQPAANVQVNDLFYNTDTNYLFRYGADGVWIATGSLKGPEGDAGADGNKFFFYNVAGGDTGPATPTILRDGRDDDLAINTANGNVWKKSGLAWRLEGSLRGADGEPGAPGAIGDPIGVGVAFPVGVPEGTLFFLTTNKTLYRRGSAAWAVVANLSGADGPRGTRIGAGTALPTADNIAGDLYLLRRTGALGHDLYQWSGAAWVERGPFDGPAGPAGASTTTGTELPDDARVGDIFLQQVPGGGIRLFQREANRWVRQRDFIGPPGPRGPTGNSNIHLNIFRSERVQRAANSAVGPLPMGGTNPSPGNRDDFAFQTYTDSAGVNRYGLKLEKNTDYLFTLTADADPGVDAGARVRMSIITKPTAGRWVATPSVAPFGPNVAGLTWGPKNHRDIHLNLVQNSAFQTSLYVKDNSSDSTDVVLIVEIPNEDSTVARSAPALDLKVEMTTGPVTGSVGDKGPAGDKGPVGDKGAVGAKGPAGVRGPANVRSSLAEFSGSGLTGQFARTNVLFSAQTDAQKATLKLNLAAGAFDAQAGGVLGHPYQAHDSRYRQGFVLIGNGRYRVFGQVVLERDDSEFVGVASGIVRAGAKTKAVVALESIQRNSARGTFGTVVTTHAVATEYMDMSSIPLSRTVIPFSCLIDQTNASTNSRVLRIRYGVAVNDTLSPTASVTEYMRLKPVASPGAASLVPSTYLSAIQLYSI